MAGRSNMHLLWWITIPYHSIWKTTCDLISLTGTVVKNHPIYLQEIQETWVGLQGQEDPLEEEIATHSSIPAWKIPVTEETGRLQSMGSQRVRQDWAHIHTHTHTFCEMYSIVLGPSELNEVLVAQSCPTLCDPRDCSLTDFPVHGILQARILAWLAIPFSRGSSLPRGWTQVSWIAGRFFTTWSAREVNNRNYSLWVVLFNGKIEKGNMLMFTCILRINMH